VGGFPFQMRAIAGLFDHTTLVVMQRQSPPPANLIPLTGHNLRVRALPEPKAQGWKRKLAVLGFIPALWREISGADAVHAPVPGDIGTLGLLIALARRRPLFVRHCGTWGDQSTLANRFLAWLLPRIAGGGNVVMATGGAGTPPCPQNPAVEWIFSTTLSEKELADLPAAAPWHRGERLRLITVGRLAEAKNIQAAIRALPLIRQQCPDVHLDIVGDGSYRAALEHLIAEMGLSDLVTLHGNVDHNEVLRLLGAAHLFVFPTRVAEGFPKALLEAMACGLPAVAPPVSVIPHLLRDGGGALLSDTEPASIAAAVVDLTSDEARFAQMAARARASSRGYTLERWQAIIGARLEQAWGPLRADHDQRGEAQPE
jgi:glycosyltransferase involved in cell wall biosynthesis